MSTLTPVRPLVDEPLTADPAPPVPRRVPWTMIALLVICAVQVGLAVRPGSNPTPFEDEGLYLYMGHRMIAHLMHGAFLSEYPGAYFSGAPGFYPVLAALGDHVGGLQGARTVSLLFALLATVSVNGIGRQLYGRAAGVLGAAAFVLCGSVIYQSNFATFDSTTLGLVAAAAWLTVYSVHHDRFLWAPAVAVLLVGAFYAKYAGAVYTPVVAALAVATAPRGARLAVTRRTVYMLISAMVSGYFIYALWGQSLRQGMAVTTTSRHVLNPASASSLIINIGQWVGPWLVLAVLGALLTRRTALVTAVLLFGSIVGPLDQVRIGESTSLAKHVAFGMIFACPLIGLLFARVVSRLRALTVPLVAVTLVGLSVSGLFYSHQFMTGWASDTPLVPVLAKLLPLTPGKPILGEQPSPERYALRGVTAPTQWDDTYSFSYGNNTGDIAYKTAIDQTSFGIIYLAKQPYPHNPQGGSLTPAGEYVYTYLNTGHTPYHLVDTVNRVVRGQIVGHWYVYLPKAVHLSSTLVGPTRTDPEIAGTSKASAPPQTQAGATPTAAPAVVGRTAGTIRDRPTPLLHTQTPLLGAQRR